MSIWDQNAMDVRQRLLWIHGGKTLEKAFFFFVWSPGWTNIPTSTYSSKRAESPQRIWKVLHLCLTSQGL